MDDPNCPVLAAAVARYDRTDRPVSVAAIGTILDRDPEEIAGRIDRLRACELLAREGDGDRYRPTVTGREFLALDVECGPIVVDPDDCR
ncbi:helix-turn-helix domain-containing protein [Halococcoides cellulosivorans]|uniref:Uncharacterized protein n=1 Tax=Halococcoides cellulosivorans TaxID=1679096 RepID=A0A2R4X1J3_9EURY|nr:hypothetical protein [Halococcoides cellulosivorans]AWB27651.1 hypothetical protein HARCEL1_07980 [Halococcoides cellulosivorans]